MKHHNPHTPIMIREALNTQPRVFARYEFGREQVEELSGEFCAYSKGVAKKEGRNEGRESVANPLQEAREREAEEHSSRELTN